MRRLLETNDAVRRRAESAELRATELEGAVRDMATGGLDPVALTGRVETLEEENRMLRQRLAQAQQTVQRILGRLQFVEEER